MTNVKREKVEGDAEALQRVANDANKKRKARVAQKAKEKRATDVLHSEAIKMNKVFDQEKGAIHSEAIKMNQVFDQEKATWESREKKPSRLGAKMKVIADGIEFPSLNAALRAMEPVAWGIENDYRKSCWTRINRNLKKKGESIVMGHEFILI